MTDGKNVYKIVNLLKLGGFNMNNKVRVLRIIEYVGDREWIEMTLKQSNIPVDGIKEFHSHDHPETKNVIKSCLVDKFPEIIK